MLWRGVSLGRERFLHGTGHGCRIKGWETRLLGCVFIGTQSGRGQRKPTDMGSVGKSLVKTEKW